MKNIPLGEWKAKHGRVFKVRLEDKDIYFRLLTVDEIEACKNNFAKVGKFLDSIILNNESLSSTGAKYKLSDFLIRNSFPSTDDQMKEKILHYRYKVKDDFVLNMIAKLCSIFVSYTPDDLRTKSIDQLLELMGIAEIMVGKQLMTQKKKRGSGNREAMQRPPDKEDKFVTPSTDELMEESSNALQAAMSKFGKHVPTLNEVKSKKPPAVPLTDLQRQMKELNSIL